MIETNQQKMQQVLKTRSIEFEMIDICAPGMQEMRKFMREKARKAEGQRNVVPPQVFNGEEYRGDFEAFDVANEDDDLEEFLGIPRKYPKAEPVKTGAVAVDVQRKQPGKLNLNESDPKSGEDFACKKGLNQQKPVQNGSTNDGVVDNLENILSKDANSLSSHRSRNTADLTDNDSTHKKEDKTMLTDCNSKDVEGLVDVNLKSENQDLEESKKFGDWKQKVEDEALQNAVEKELEKTDGLVTQNKDIGMNPEACKYSDGEDEEDDSSDYSSDEDNTVEYMPDGEVVRKTSRGFKQLNNCKRFWKVSLLV